MNLDPPVAFAARAGTPPALGILVNFGILAGRDATPAEIDDLARELLELVEDVSIVSEQHHEFGHGHEATVHQVRVEIAEGSLPDDAVAAETLTQRLVDAAGRWAHACAAARRAEL